jgi:hypothetical protein
MTTQENPESPRYAEAVQAAATRRRARAHVFATADDSTEPEPDESHWKYGDYPDPWSGG